MAPRVATEDAPHTLGAAFDQAVFFEREAGVLGTRRAELAVAVWKKLFKQKPMIRRKGFLVNPDQKNDDPRRDPRNN